MFADYMEGMVQAISETYRQGGVPEDQVAALDQALRAAGRAIYHLSLAIGFCGSLILAWVNLLAGRGMEALRNFGPDQTALTQWRAPEPLIWVVIGAALLMVFTQGWLFWLGANVLMVSGVLYFLQGMAVLAFWLRKKQAPRLARIALYALVTIVEFLLLLLVVVGLFDLWFDFRRLKKKNQPA
jgi:uncharacterized protein YybS (DUF2232 family)